ncbi:hypothetical protein AWH61_08160 [Alteromonas sp. W12]|uniref:hypothetical protein n=1 Tax=Alteromonas sp. W12 TaxID=1772289 RepID=UPI000948DF17|nr:hypothetical protein [Alteromonas sp. W12]OLF76890.1 hypothetical protein AWH61_08160 [Alteromonas sp. W12]
MKQRTKDDWNLLAPWIRNNPKRFDKCSKEFQVTLRKYLSAENEHRDELICDVEKHFFAQKTQFKENCRSYLKRTKERDSEQLVMENIQPLVSELQEATGFSYLSQNEVVRFALLIAVKLFTNNLVNLDDNDYGFEDNWSSTEEDLDDFKDASLEQKLKSIVEHDLVGEIDRNTANQINLLLTTWASTNRFMNLDPGDMFE